MNRYKPYSYYCPRCEDRRALLDNYNVHIVTAGCGLCKGQKEPSGAFKAKYIILKGDYPEEEWADLAINIRKKEI